MCGALERMTCVCEEKDRKGQGQDEEKGRKGKEEDWRGEMTLKNRKKESKSAVISWSMNLKKKIILV